MKIKDLYIPFVVQKNFLMSIWKDSKKALILRVMLIILNGLNSVVCAYCPKMFVDQIVITGKFFNGFIYILLMILFLTINRIVSLVESNVMGVAIEKAKIVQKTVFLQNMNNIEGPFFDSASNKNKLKIAKQYNENGGVNILDIITQILTNFISLIGMLLALPFISIWVYLLLVGVSVFRFIGNAKISKNENIYHKERTPSLRKKDYYASLLENFTSFFELNENNAIFSVIKKYKSECETYLNLQKRHYKEKGKISFLIFLTYPIQNIFLYCYVGISLVGGNFTVGEYTLIFAAVAKISQIIEYFLNIPQKYYPQILNAKDYIDYEKTIANYKEFVSNKTSISSIETIEFRKVTFQYTGNNNFALKPMSFYLKKGEKVAIIGANGVGKSTILKLMMKWYSPNEGDILVNGINIRNIERKELWKYIAVTQQTGTVYSLCLNENIALSSLESINNSKVHDCLTLVGLKEKYGDKLFADITRRFCDDGIEFSGGEIQKISLARNFYKNSDVIILDEPTSALDPLSERDILKNIDKISKEKILIFVTHRLSNCINANKIIYVGNNGSIEYIGSHNELMINAPEYREIFNSQANSYKCV